MSFIHRNLRVPPPGTRRAAPKIARLALCEQPRSHRIENWNLYFFFYGVRGRRLGLDVCRLESRILLYTGEHDESALFECGRMR